MANEDSFSNYRQSYPDGYKDNHTWGGRLEKLARVIPHKVAFIQGARELTWSQMNRRANRMANALLDLGVGKEDRVAIMGFNSLEWVEAYFAASRIGAVPVNVNPRFIPAELKYIIEDSDSKVLFMDPDGVDRIQEVWGELDLLEHVIVFSNDAPEGMHSHEDLMSSYLPSKPQPSWSVTNEDFAYLFYTGGTTGYPKGTVWDGHSRVRGLDTMVISATSTLTRNLSDMPSEAYTALSATMPFFPPESLVKSNLYRKLAEKQIESEFMDNLSLKILGSNLMYRIAGGLTRLLIVAPLFHGAAYDSNFGLLGSMGATTIYLTKSHTLDPKDVWRTLEQKRANTMLIVGDAFAIPLLEELEQGSYNTTSLSMIVSSGVVLSPRIKKRFLKQIPNLLIMDHLGTTESSTAFSHMSTAADKEVAALRIKPAESGIHISRVFNPETGKTAAPGELGELAYGGNTALGYWKDPDKTARSWKVIDGRRWFFVGDQGTLDKDGYFHFQGRGPTVINTGGEKVYPEEVEDIIKGHPAVREAAVTSVPNERWGEAVTALVVLSPGAEAGEEQLIEYCRERMAGYKKPRHIVFVKELPVSPAGKLERRNLKDIAKANI